VDRGHRPGQCPLHHKLESCRLNALQQILSKKRCDLDQIHLQLRDLDGVLLGASVESMARGWKARLIQARSFPIGRSDYQDATGESFHHCLADRHGYCSSRWRCWSSRLTKLFLQTPWCLMSESPGFFRVCNTGNTADTFSLTSFDLTARQLSTHSISTATAVAPLTMTMRRSV